MPATSNRTRIAWVVRLLPGFAALFTFGVLARGGFQALSTVGAYELAAVGLTLAGLSLSAVRRARRSASGVPALLRDELELGGCVLAFTFAAIALAGERSYPVVYLLSAFGVTFFSRPAAITLLGAAVLFDAQSTLAQRPVTFVWHTLFLAAFAALYHAVLSGRVAASRKAEDEAVKNRLREVEERARTFRLATSGSQDSSPSINDKEKWLLASVKEIEGALGAALEIAEQALHTHTCAVFLLGADDRSLKLHDCRSASDAVQRDRLPAGEGVFGAMLKRGQPMRLSSPGGVKGVTHYEVGGPTPCALLAVPIMEAGGLVRGVLVADRLAAEAFTEHDERLLTTIASEVLRSVEVERVMGYIRKARDEKDRFFRAIEELNRAGSPDQVFLAVLESARQIAPLDFCAVTLVTDEKGQRMHRIARMTGVTAQGRALEGKTFADNNGLVANVVRYGAPLPGREVVAMDRQVIFDGDTQVRGLQSLKIFPLVAGDRILGTLVAGSRKRSAIDGEAQRMLEVIAIQAAQAVLRAQLFEQMERMATTDGLTTLLNHRTFQVRFDEALAAAKRYGRKCSVILTDIDHFKSVNDTWGHPVGDLVLKGVAKILKDKARDTDVVARYGGEEFAIIMPETDTKGALVIAERIREAVMAEVHQSDQGPLKVTLSLGIATFPEAAQDKQTMVDLADQCLYFAKRHGRNQSVTVAQMQAGKRVAG
ncbi:MAG: sensor domain-containing diguanylate cyclase [Archangiaceae bacterium]|nr:sensor domain-containing diguanylate cyclase [Archangiaceae bacterium]